MANSTDTYLNSIGRLPLLTAQEEIVLGRAIQAHLNHPDYPNVPLKVKRQGERALRRLITCNLRLVVHVARKFERRLLRGSTDFLDLVQEANIGLVRAAEKFDPERGYRFSTYAYWWIRQACTRTLDSKQRLVHLPANVAEALARGNKTIRELSNKLGRMPTRAEMAEAMGLDVETYEQVLIIGSAPGSLDAPVQGTSDLRIMDIIADPASIDSDEELVMSSWQEQLDNAWTFLRDDEQELLSRRYGLHGHHPQTYAEIQEKLGVSRERCRQRVVMAERRLRYLTSQEPTLSQAARCNQWPVESAPAAVRSAG